MPNRVNGTTATATAKNKAIPTVASRSPRFTSSGYNGLDQFCFEEVDDFGAGWDGGFGVGEGGAGWLLVFACTGGGGGGVGLLLSRRGESDAVDFVVASDVVRVGGVGSKCLGKTRVRTRAAGAAAGGAGDVACHGVDGVVGGADGDGVAAGGGGDESGGQAEGEADPGREADGGRRDARPQEHQAGGDGASADDDAEDGQEPGRIEADDVEEAADDGQDEGVDDDAVMRDPDELAGGGVRLDVGFVDVEVQEGGDGDQFGGGGAGHRHEQEEKLERCPTGPEEGDGCGGRRESGAVLFRGQPVGG